MKKLSTVSSTHLPECKLLFCISLIFISQNLYSQCDSPSPYAPENGSTVNTLTPTLCWMGGYNYLYGNLRVATDPGFNNIVYSYMFSINENCKTIPAIILQWEQWYWWRISVVCPHGTAGSNSYHFQPSLLGIKTLGTDVPGITTLFQNYPNPFNPTTNIKFTLPLTKGVGGMDIKLIIYDILGREVATLVNEHLKPGTYEYEWPAPSGDGSNFASGIYFYKLQTEDFTQTKRMVLIK